MIKKYAHLFISCMFCLLACGYCGAQEVPPVKKGTDTAGINQAIKNALVLAIPDSAIEALKIAAQKSIDGNYFVGAADALCGAGAKFVDLADYQEGFNYCKESLVYAEKAAQSGRISKCYNCFGAIYAIEGNYVMASEEYLKGLDELKNNNTGVSRDAIFIYNNLASIYEKMGQYDKQLYYIDQAEITNKNGDLSDQAKYYNLANVFLNKGAYYSDVHKPDSAISYYEQALDIAGKLNEKNAVFRTGLQSEAKVNLGDMLISIGEFNKAVSYLQPIVSNVQNKHTYLAAVAAYKLGKALFYLKKYKDAEAIILSGLKESGGLYANSEAINGYRTLADIYKATKQYKKALDCMDSIIVLKDTLVTAEKVKAIDRAEAKYNMAEKDRQITKNELLIAQQKNKITRKNVLIGSIIASVLLLIILSIGLYRSGRLKQARIIKSLKQENMISILKGVVQGEENERTRLARELHDGIGGMLSATKLRFMALRHENEGLVRSPGYLEAIGLLDIMGDEIRKTSHNLMPEALLKQDLAEALRTYCNNMQAGSSLHVDFQSFGDFDALPNDFKLNIYRIVQELLKNTLQHAKATYVVVQLMMLDAYLTISVEDNGIGFNADETKDGIGLHNLKTRVLNHEGHYTLRSEPGKGTTAYIEFGMPLAGQT